MLSALVTTVSSLRSASGAGHLAGGGAAGEPDDVRTARQPHARPSARSRAWRRAAGRRGSAPGARRRRRAASAPPWVRDSSRWSSSSARSRRSVAAETWKRVGEVAHVHRAGRPEQLEDRRHPVGSGQRVGGSASGHGGPFLGGATRASWHKRAFNVSLLRAFAELRQDPIMTASRTTVITFVGAGSVVFTRDLRRRPPADARPRPGSSCALHDIDAERLATAEALTARVAAQLGATPTVTAPPRPARRARGRRLRHQLDPGRRARRHPHRLRRPGPVRAEPDHRRHHRHRRHLPGAAHLPGARRHRRRHARRSVRDAWLLNYTNPMAMNIAYLAETAPTLQGRRYVPLRLLDGRTACASWSASRWRRSSTASAGVNHQAWLLRWEHEGQSLYPLLDARIEADPELRRRVRVDMYRRFGYYPTETSEHSSEYVPWYLHHDQRDRPAAHPGRRLRRASARTTSRSTRRPARSCSPTSRSSWRATHRVRPAGHPLPRHRHQATDLRQRRRTRASSPTCPTGARGRGPGPARRARRAADARR